MYTAEQDEILKLLERPNYVCPQIAEAIRKYMIKWNRSGFHALLEIHFMNESDLANKIAEFAGIVRILDLNMQVIDLELMRKLPFDLARQFESIVIGRDEFNQNAVTVVMADPTRTDYLDMIRKHIGSEILLAVAERSDIHSAINSNYPLDDQLPSLAKI